MYTCIKCGATASSKCPSMRSVFVSNIMVAMMKSVSIFRAIPFSEGGNLKCLNLETGCYEDDISLVQMIINLRESLGSMSDDEIGMLVCDHHWTQPEGQVCELEGHEHK